MKILHTTAAICAALALAPMVARAEGDVAVTDADLQRLLGPTLRSVQVEASSAGGVCRDDLAQRNGASSAARPAALHDSRADRAQHRVRYPADAQRGRADFRLP